MVELRVSRRSAFAAAAGWVAAPVRAGSDWACGAEVEESGSGPADVRETTGGDRVFLLYRALARFLRDPDPDRAGALRRALGRRYAPAAAAYGPNFIEYLLDQTAGLGPEDAAWTAAADAADVARQVHDGLAGARRLLDVDVAPAVFLIFSRRFDGRADGRTISFGVNRFGAERLRGQVALLTVHEYHHIARARVAPFTTLLDAVVAEGLATACSALSDPGRPLTDYLLFAPGQLDWYTPSRLRRLWAALAADADSKDLRRRAAYLDGGCDGPHGAPSRSGYYLGYLMVHDRLARGDTIADLTRMSTRDIWRDHVRRMKDEG